VTVTMLTKEQIKWIEKIEADVDEFVNVPEELVTEEFCIEAVYRNDWALVYWPKKFKTDDRKRTGEHEETHPVS